MVGNVYPKEIKQLFHQLMLNQPVDLRKLNDIIIEVTSGQAIMNIRTTITLWE